MAKIFSEAMVNRRIALLRRESGWSLEDFSELLGVSKTSFNNYEKDKQSPGCHFFIKAQAVFGGSVVAWLLGDGDDKDIARFNIRRIADTFNRKEAIRTLRSKTFSERFT